MTNEGTTSKFICNLITTIKDLNFLHKDDVVSSWSPTTSNSKYPTEKLVKDSLDSHIHNSQISYGKVDSTSTSTVFTATVPNLTSLVDGATVMLRNGVVTSASGFTLNVNNLGAKPVYNSMADASADTTTFNTNYTMLFVYDSTRVAGGCWICYRGYNSDTNTIGHQLRTNSMRIYATDKTYRYRLLLKVDDTHYMPVNTSTSTSADANKSSSMNTREFRIGGDIRYYSYTSAINQNAQFGATYQWQQYPLALGYSFNNTGSALTLTQWSPVYMVAEPSATNKGMAKLVSPYYTQTLPSSADGKIYIYLGQAYSATNIELTIDHPIYEYKDGGIRLYRDTYTASEVDTLLDGKSDTGHTHSQYLTSHQSLKTINGEPLVGSGDITITGSGGDDSEFLTGSFSGDSSYIIVANSSKSTINDGDRFYVHITNTSTSTSNARLSVGYGGGNYYANGVIYDNYTPIQSNQIIADTIILVECSIGNDYSWNVVEMWSYAPVNHTHSDYANSSHTHTKSQITDFPTIPSKTSDLTNDSGFLTSHQSLANYVQKSSTTGLLKNDGSVDTTSYLSSLPSHTHTVSNITDTNTYSNIGNSSQTQESINGAINSKLGDIVTILMGSGN